MFVSERIRTLNIPRFWKNFSIAAVSLAGLIYLREIDPNVPGHYPICPLYFLTGFYCPGCGSLRAIHDLTVGDIHGAFAMNPLIVVFIPFLLIYYIYKNLSKKENIFIPSWISLLCFAIIVLYWILRNVPGFEFLGPIR